MNVSKGTRKWARAAAVRAAKTAAQVGVVLIGSDIVSIVELNWLYILGAMAAAAVLSALTSVAGIPEVDDGASLPKIEEA